MLTLPAQCGREIKNAFIKKKKKKEPKTDSEPMTCERVQFCVDSKRVPRGEILKRKDKKQEIAPDWLTIKPLWHNGNFL